VQPSGSWLYVWIDVETAEIAYVGGTGFDPELRAHLHLASEDPLLGRVRAEVSGYDTRDFDVLAFELTDAVDRVAAKQALVTRLAGDGAPGEMTELIEPVVRAIAGHRASTGRRAAAS